jgi:chloramphenicol O-acetyltransferase type B
MIEALRKFFYKLKRTYYKKNIINTCLSYKEPLRVNGTSYVTRNTILGSNVNFNGMGISGKGKVMIGNNFHSGRNCFIITQNHNFDHGKSIPYDNTYITRDVVIEDNVWLGQGVIILSGVTIGEGSIIQAGSVVVKSIPKYGIAGGHPAKVFKYRDIDHYEKLKAAEQFH